MARPRHGQSMVQHAGEVFIHMQPGSRCRAVEAHQQAAGLPVAERPLHPVEPRLDEGMQRGAVRAASRMGQAHLPARAHGQARQDDDRRRRIEPGKAVRVDRGGHSKAQHPVCLDGQGQGATTSSVVV